MSTDTAKEVKSEGLNCEMCNRTDANFYSMSGGVFANLCPEHRTKVHGYATTELPMTEFNEAYNQRRKEIKEGGVRPSTLFDWLDFELEIHKGMSRFIYG